MFPLVDLIGLIIVLSSGWQRGAWWVPFVVWVAVVANGELMRALTGMPSSAALMTKSGTFLILLPLAWLVARGANMAWRRFTTQAGRHREHASSTRAPSP